MLFQDVSEAYNVLFDKTAYENMISYCDNADLLETGGILIGNYSNDFTVANILQIESQPPKSRGSKIDFFRGNTGLKELLDALWERGCYYIGEWHYHPNSSSNPSNVDIQQMLILSKNKKLNCPEPILVIVGGYCNNHTLDVRVFTEEKEIILKRK